MTTLDDAAERKISACLALVGTTGMETTHRDTLRKLWLAATEAAAKKCERAAIGASEPYSMACNDCAAIIRNDCAAAIRGKGG